MAQSTLKYSRQREAIRTYLMSTTSHPTAEMVYEAVRPMYPKISLGTVYRNLSLLVELGEAVKVTGVNGQDHFDGNVLPHTHVVCLNCGNVFDLDMPEYEDMDRQAAEHFKGSIIRHSLYFYGYCADCESGND